MKMNNTRFRLLLGLALALLLGTASFIGVSAGPSEQEDPPIEEKCQTCHPALALSWENSAHGQAMVDPIFQENYIEAGEPRECLFCHTTEYDPTTGTWAADGISCAACHSPIAENHPTDPMPSDRSASLCEQCHSQTVFEWQLSVHRESGLDCVDCHGQHTTTLKTEDAAELCASCHRDRASNFAHSEHSKQNLTCPDCHLETLNENTLGDRGHSGKDHSFRPKLDACNECHSYQMHDPIDVHSGTDVAGNENLVDISEVQSQGVNIDPNPVNPISFALVAALIGMVAGLLLAPWVQEWYHKFDFTTRSNQDSDGESKDGE